MTNTPNRKHTRLEHYDYTNGGGYFITLVTYLRKPIFDRIVDNQVQLSKYGQIVRDEWLRTEKVRPAIRLDEFVIMPVTFMPLCSPMTP